MPFQLLEMLAHALLPIEIEETEEINAVLALNAAGLVIAEIPQVVRSREGPRYAGRAVVSAVTSEGFSVLKKRAQHPGLKQE